MRIRFLQMMASKYKENFINKIEKQLSTIKTNLVHLSFAIDNISDKDLQKILQHSFVLTSYGYLEGFFKNTLTDYLNFLQNYHQNNPSKQLSCMLHYFYRFSEKSKKDKEFCKQVISYFKSIFINKTIIKQNKASKSSLSNFIVNCDNNMKYDILILLLHLFSLNLRNYEEFYDSNRAKYSTEKYLNDFVEDRNTLAHGEIGCLMGTFNLKQDYKMYKFLVIYLVDSLKDEITEIITNDGYLLK